MKIAFIVVLYKTPRSEIVRLKKEIKDLHFKESQVFCIDNSKNNKGYAFGVNKGIQKAIKVGAEIFIVMNPDISIQGISKNQLFAPSSYFDIWGFSMKQHGTIYYKGLLDKWRLSAFLTTIQPNKQYVSTEFVTGSLMVIKKKVIEKIGLLDESYGMYYEDMDYCLRARQAGLKIGIDSAVNYEHFEWSTQNSKKNKLLANSRLKFFWKYSNMKQKAYELLRLPRTTIEWFLLQLK